MKFMCEKAEIQSAVTAASRAVATKSSIPALEGLLLEAANELTITGYDLKTGITAKVQSTIIEPGKIVVDRKMFAAIIQKMPDDVVTINAENGNMEISCGSVKFSVMTSSPKDYPDLPSADTMTSFEVHKESLKSALNGSVFAVSRNDSRPIHTGSLFEVDGNELTVVSVDGFRLALQKVKLDMDYQSMSFVVPGAALKEVINICGQFGDTVEVKAGKKHIEFTLEGITLISRRLEGQFLNYRKSVPDNNPVLVTINRRELIAAIERCSIVVTEQQKSPLKCLFSDTSVSLKCSTPIGTAVDNCCTEVQRLAGAVEGEIEIGFNYIYMLDALKASPSDVVVLAMKNGVSPVIITATDNNKFKHMVLPVRLKAGQ